MQVKQGSKWLKLLLQLPQICFFITNIEEENCKSTKTLFNEANFIMNFRGQLLCYKVSD